MNFSSLFEIIRKNSQPALYLIVAGLFISSCAGTKYLKDGERVLNKYSIKGVGPGKRDGLDPLLEQKPNTRFLVKNGPAHLVTIYQIGKKNFLFHFDSARIINKRTAISKKLDGKINNTKRENKKKRLTAKKVRKISKKNRALSEGNQLMRWGEPLSVYDEEQTKLSKGKMHQLLNSRGYYANKIKVTERYTGKKRLKVNVTYDVKLGPPYMIDSIEYIIPDWRVADLFHSFSDEVILKKIKIKQDDMSAERDRVYNLMVNRGYYAFTKNLVRFEIDTVTLGPRKLIVREIINNPPGQDAHKKFFIDSVIFVTDAGGSTAKNIPDDHYQGVTYTHGRFKYSPKILDWNNHLYPNKVYQRDNVLETQRQLSYLDNFKFINVNFDTIGTKFIAHIFTSPADKYQTSTEVGLSVTQGLPGPFANLNIKNRNLFHGLEIVELNTHFKVEGLGGVSSQSTTYSSLQYGSELSITFPQFLSPLGRFYKRKIANFNPRTRFGLAFGHEDRFTEYTRTTINTSTAYLWKVKDHISYTLTPMNMSYIESNVTPEFQVFLDTLVSTGNSYANTFKSSFIGNGSFQVIVNNNYGQSKSSSYMQFYLETGGFLFSLLGPEPFGNSLEYFKYTKTNVDLRRTFNITRNQSIATRFNVGLAVPYGSNKSLPYEKYFFAGGSNSIRAWQPRRLGPGGYGAVSASNEVLYQREQPGDLLLETSIEFRQKLTGFIDWAMFVDAGNVWLIRSETIDPVDDPEGDDGVFKVDEFLNEVAVGAGVGLRFDLSFLIFRLDLGWKVLDPARPLGERWVASENEILRFKNRWPFVFFDPFKNATLNIGIGYPF